MQIKNVIGSTMLALAILACGKDVADGVFGRWTEQPNMLDGTGTRTGELEVLENSVRIYATCESNGTTVTAMIEAKAEITESEIRVLEDKEHSETVDAVTCTALVKICTMHYKLEGSDTLIVSDSDSGENISLNRVK